MVWVSQPLFHRARGSSDLSQSGAGGEMHMANMPVTPTFASKKTRAAGLSLSRISRLKHASGRAMFTFIITSMGSPARALRSNMGASMSATWTSFGSCTAISSSSSSRANSSDSAFSSEVCTALNPLTRVRFMPSRVALATV